jgi:phage terminase large subunit-like protein
MASTRSRAAVLLDGPAPPRVRVAPNARANSWEDVADLAASLGMPLDEWQEQALEAAMGERSDGRWASKFVGISAPRQNGKSQLIVARALAGILLFDEKMVIISAHETDTAREVWKRLIDVVEDNPHLEGRVTERINALNREFLSFGHGADRQTIKLKARGSSGSRGFSADCLLLDEGQILGKQAWGSIQPTMSAMPNPQLWLFGTPPTETDDPFAFSRVRDSAMAKKVRHCWLEWSADPDDDIDDPETWAKANPAFGVRISQEACADDRAAMDDQQFCVERLGMWASSTVKGVIPPPSWRIQEDRHSIAVDNQALGLEVGPDLSWASIALAGQRIDGQWHFELENDQHISGRGTSWLAPAVQAIVEANPQIRAVVVDVGGPIAALLEQKAGRWLLKGTRVEVTPMKVSELGSACSLVLDGIVTGWLHHIGQPQFTSAALVAGKRALGDSGKWVWSRKTAESDITPIQAATYALHGAQSPTVKRPSRRPESKRGVVVL